MFYNGFKIRKDAFWEDIKMSIMNETIVLANGTAMPKIGFGTWQTSPEDALRIVDFALNNEYIHIDGAYSYGNSKENGQAIADSGVAREDIWITTKVHGDSKSYDEAKANIEAELANYQTDYLDLVLIHAPRPWGEMHTLENRYFAENLEVWRAMEEAYEAGKIRAIGVSNFEIDDLQNIMENSQTKPMVNQIKYMIGLTQDELVEFCREQGIVIQAYSPLGTGRLLGNPLLEEIAVKYDKSVAQLAIAYCLQKGHVVLPKSVTEKYVLDNRDVDFEISAEDMEYLDSLENIA